MHVDKIVGISDVGIRYEMYARETAFYQSMIADYSPYEQWSEEGRLTAEQRANRVWKRMLAEYQDPGIDPAKDEAMLDFIARRKAVLTDDITDE